MNEPRKYLRIDPPDNDTLIFLDQVVSLIRNGSGCILRTTDGVTFSFNGISFEEMVTKITEWKGWLPE